MTVATNTNKVQYVGDGAVSQFSVPFPFFEDTDLEVYTQASAAAAVELKTLGTHYTIIGKGEKLTGEVDWSVTPPASGVSILIKRVIPQTQDSDYVNNDIFNAETLEDDFDRAVMRDQQIQEELDRAVKVGPFGSAQVFPDPLDGYFLFWSSGILANGIPGSLSGIIVTPYTLNLLDDASAGDARATLGLSPVGSWDVQSGGEMVINSGGELRASTGGTVDLASGTLVVPRAGAVSGIASGQIQLNGVDLEIDPDGTGFDKVGPRLTSLASQATIVSNATNNSYAAHVLPVPDGAWAVEVGMFIANGNRIRIKPNGSYAERTFGMGSTTEAYFTATIPITSDKKILAKRALGSSYYTLWLMGYWR